MRNDAFPATDAVKADRHGNEDDPDEQDDHLEDIGIDDCLEAAHRRVREDDRTRQHDGKREANADRHLDQLGASNDLAADKREPCNADNDCGNGPRAPVVARLEQVAGGQALDLVGPALDLWHHQERHHDDAQSRYRDQPGA